MKRVAAILVVLSAMSVLSSGCLSTSQAPADTKVTATAVIAPDAAKSAAPSHRTCIGIGMGGIADEDRGSLPLPAGAGLIVTQVMDNSPAAGAGIQENDMLVKYNDQLLIYPHQLRTLVRLARPGEVVVLTALRDGKETKINVTLGKEEVTEENADEPAPEEEEVEALPDGEFAWLGVAPGAMEDDERSNANLASGTGVIVRSVLEDSPALKAGIQENDVLVKYNDQLLTFPVQLRRLVKINKPGDTVTLMARRDGKDMEFKVTLGKTTRAILQPPEGQ
jgi:S1-C subfamily serine protease